MKVIIFIFLLSLNAKAATLCEVYGISDSPQSLKCRFSREDLALSCREGIYYLGEQIVEAAFHYEVEEGPVPLVFKTKERELIVTLSSGRNHKASLTGIGSKQRGNCKP